MNIERIRSFYFQRPARPFVVHTSSGENDTVRHPETMAIDEEDGIIFLLPDRGKLAMLDIASITEITQDFRKQESGAGA